MIQRNRQRYAARAYDLLCAKCVTPGLQIALKGAGPDWLRSSSRERNRHSVCQPHVPVVISILLLLWSACTSNTPESVEEETEPEVEIVFTDVTQVAGLDEFQHVTGAFGKKWFPETMGAGAGFLDYNDDGLLDIMLVVGSTFPSRGEAAPDALRLFRNLGDGTFEEATTAAGLSQLKAYAFGITAADYDNDGDVDVFVTTLFENLLLRNMGARFEEVGSQAGVAGGREWSSAAVFFDADKDSYLDLYVGNYVDWSPEGDIYCTRVGDTKSYCTPEQYEGLSGRFYRNQGDGTFLEQSDSFNDMPGKTLGAISVDYNRDGWIDLIVANDTQRDLLFENQGDGNFEEKGVPSGIAFDENGRARAGMGIDVGIVDESSEITVFVGHFSSEMVGVYSHMGNGFFADRAAISQIGRPSLRTLTFGLLLGDLDLDSDLDLFTANGHITEDIGEVEEGITYRQRPQLYKNEGAGIFAEAAAVGVLKNEMLARGAAWADYDLDGDLDLLITENGGPAHLWRNDTQGGNYLQVNLTGSESNRDGLGSRVVIVAGGKRQERELRAGASYLSQSQRDPTFGLGNATRVDTLWVHWPSGQVSQLGPLDANQTIHIQESE